MSANPKNFGGYLWNPYMRSYVPLIGRPVDTSGVRNTVAEIRRGSSERMAKLAQGVLDGEITNLAEFAVDFKQEIKRLYLSTHILARGGVAQMTQSDWGKLGAAVKEQLEYANNFVRDIENARIGITDLAGDVIVRESGIPELGDGFLARTEMYTESAWGGAGEFENVVRDRELKLGSLERRVLGKSVKSCDDCIELAERGWQPPSLLPDIGDTECLTTGHSRVFCKRGWIPISEIVVGDYVFTHMSRWRKVTATSKRVAEPERKCFKILAPTSEWIGCTADHEWLTDKGWKQTEEINGSELSIQQAEAIL